MLRGAIARACVSIDLPLLVKLLRCSVVIVVGVELHGAIY